MGENNQFRRALAESLGGAKPKAQSKCPQCPLINKKIHIPAIDIIPVILGSSITNLQYPQLNEPLNDRLRVGARKTGPVNN